MTESEKKFLHRKTSPKLKGICSGVRCAEVKNHGNAKTKLLASGLKNVATVGVTVTMEATSTTVHPHAANASRSMELLSIGSTRK